MDEKIKEERFNEENINDDKNKKEKKSKEKNNEESIVGFYINEDYLFFWTHKDLTIMK